MEDQETAGNVTLRWILGIGDEPSSYASTVLATASQSVIHSYDRLIIYFISVAHVTTLSV
jgi:hypothetical protein